MHDVVLHYVVAFRQPLALSVRPDSRPGRESDPHASGPANGYADPVLQGAGGGEAELGAAQEGGHVAAEQAGAAAGVRESKKEKRENGGD